MKSSSGVAPIIVLVAGLGCLANLAFAGQFKRITIDGQFDDWPGVPVGVDDELDAEGSFDLRDVSVANNHEFLYIRARLHGEANYASYHHQVIGGYGCRWGNGARLGRRGLGAVRGEWPQLPAEERGGSTRVLEVTWPGRCLPEETPSSLKYAFRGRPAMPRGCSFWVVNCTQTDSSHFVNSRKLLIFSGPEKWHPRVDAIKAHDWS